MTKKIKMLGAAFMFFLIVPIPPAFSEDEYQHKLILRSGEAVQCDRAWMAPEDIVRCKIGGEEILYSTDEIDLEKTFGKSWARTREKKGEEKELPYLGPYKKKSGIGITLGTGKLSGYTKYQIGGAINDIFVGRYEVHFPISELDFPLDVYMVSAGAFIESRESWKLGLDIEKNITSDAGKIKDSDWGAYYLEEYVWAEQGTLDIYSESDADLEALMIDIKCQYRFYRKPNWSLLGGLGYMFQHFDYEVSNLDQWYPSSYYYFGEDSGHEYLSGKVLTYETIYHIPYLEVAAEINIKDRFSIEGGLGYAPYLHAWDKDNHLARIPPILAEGNYYGDAILLFLEGRYYLKKNWFITAKFDYKKIEADGEQNNYIEGIWVWITDASIESEQTFASASIGYLF